MIDSSADYGLLNHLVNSTTTRSVGFEYTGCYKDEGTRSLVGVNWLPQDITINRCFLVCVTTGSSAIMSMLSLIENEIMKYFLSVLLRCRFLLLWRTEW